MRFFSNDVFDTEAWHATCEEITNKFEKLDILVKNAGVLIAKDIRHVTLEECRIWFRST